MSKAIDTFFNQAKKWQDEMKLLRSIVVNLKLLSEEYKWRQPCYTYKGKNILMISAFNSNCVLSFFKGTLLNDKHNMLRKPGENSQSSMVIRFEDTQKILDSKNIIEAYIKEAIENENKGLKVSFDKSNTISLPEELETKFQNEPIFQKAFEALSPGRQRGYLLHFSGAKQSQTRQSRIEKYAPRILDGKGINDCVCGHSKKMPNCDGSHKFLK